MRGFEVASIEPLDRGDAVIDFEVTANRPDALSVLGLAREVATAYDLPLLLPETGSAGERAARGGADRRLRSHRSRRSTTRSCARGMRRRSRTSRVGPSPPWLAARLQAAGVRPISNIVDITNYVNLELGQPMHAFDLARLAGAEIRARRAKPGETITTLDGVDAHARAGHAGHRRPRPRAGDRRA